MSDFADFSGEPWYKQLIGVAFIFLMLVIATPITYIADFLTRRKGKK